MDTLTKSERSARMALVRGRDTRPERIVRRLCWRLGYRYRLSVKSLPGRPDLVFRRLHRVIFVHGCFWHRHPDPACRLARMPKSRLDFWQKKLSDNRQRDLRTLAALDSAGWQCLVVWECELADEQRLAGRLRTFLESGLGAWDRPTGEKPLFAGELKAGP